MATSTLWSLKHNVTSTCRVTSQRHCTAETSCQRQPNLMPPSLAAPYHTCSSIYIDTCLVTEKVSDSQMSLSSPARFCAITKQHSMPFRLRCFVNREYLQFAHCPHCNESTAITRAYNRNETEAIICDVHQADNLYFTAYKYCLKFSAWQRMVKRNLYVICICQLMTWHRSLGC